MLKNASHKLFLFFGFFVVTYIAHQVFSRGGAVVFNRGLAFGWWPKMAGFAGQLVLWVWWIWWWRSGGFLAGGWLVLAGGIGNLSDRLTFGAVRDYWCYFSGLCNNVYDFLIFGGLVLMYIEWKRTVN